MATNKIKQPIEGAGVGVEEIDVTFFPAGTGTPTGVKGRPSRAKPPSALSAKPTRQPPRFTARTQRAPWAGMTISAPTRSDRSANGSSQRT